jgi:arylsulfatase A
MTGRALIALLLGVAASAVATEKPNIIFMLADDYGMPGVGCYGGKYATPNLDALAAGGVRFERCFSAPLCAPSRALCMFGRYAFRTGVLDNGCGAAAKPQSEVCIAKTLKSAGYATAVAGKWSQLEYLSTPDEAQAWGFDEFCRWEKSRGERYWKPALNRNGQRVPVTAQSYGPDIVHEFVVDFIRRHKDGPFFIYYPTPLIHGPIERTPDSRGGKQSFYADNVAYLDKLVGKLTAALDELGIREKTLIVFAGDNGSTGKGTGTLNGRAVDGHKSQLNEGGSRVPLIASWKGVTSAGKVLPDLVDFSDFYATFAEAAGATLPEGVKLDSHSFAPQLRGEAGAPREWVYVQLGRQCYVRSDRWKLTGDGELFDMSCAPFTEVPAQNAEARQQLQQVLTGLSGAPSGSGRAPQSGKAIRGKRAGGNGK